jgi:hypothetical protein
LNTNLSLFIAQQLWYPSGSDFSILQLIFYYGFRASIANLKFL